MIDAAKNSIAYLKANKERFFWYWVAYHMIKGTLTTIFIWIPLLYMWLNQ